MTNKEYVCLRYKDKMYITEKCIQEANDKAMLRLWYIAQKQSENNKLTEKELISLSHIYVNEKYMQMKY